MKAVAQVRGDFGNPKGTGYAKLTVDNCEQADAEACLTDFSAFCNGLKSNGFTDCNIGSLGVTVYDPAASVAKPAADVNIDSQLVVRFRKGTEMKVRRITISGIDPDSAHLESTSAGRRLTTAGAAALKTLIDAFFGWTDLAVIDEGKHLIKS